MTRRVSLSPPVLIAFFLISAPLVFISTRSYGYAAAPSSSLTTSPVSLDLTIHPGSTSTQTLRVLNNLNQPITIDMSLNIFGAYGDTGQASITAPAESDPSAGYVTFSPSSFVAQPHVESQVKMTIKLPLTATLGYYYAAVFRPIVPLPITTKTEIVKGSNAILILVDTQSANETRQAEIGNFTVSKKLYEYLPAQFTVSVHNTGNIFLAPLGDIYISRSSNLAHSIASLPINSGRGNVLPDSYRDFQQTWADGFPVFVDKMTNGNVVKDKKGNDVMQLRWNLANLNKIRFGEYYAGVTLIYNNGTKTIPLTAVVSFWVIPWKILIILIVFLLLVLFGFWTIGRGIYRRIKHLRNKGRPHTPKLPTK